MSGGGLVAPTIFTGRAWAGRDCFCGEERRVPVNVLLTATMACQIVGFKNGGC